MGLQPGTGRCDEAAWELGIGLTGAVAERLAAVAPASTIAIAKTRTKRFMVVPFLELAGRQTAGSVERILVQIDSSKYLFLLVLSTLPPGWLLM